MCLKKCFAVMLVAFLSHSSYAVNVLKANTEFKKGNHKQAFSLYEEGAKLGNAHAQYQLGVMYSKGLGVESSAVSSMIYLSLAAEQRYHNAQSIIEKLRSSLNEQDLSLLTKAIEEQRTIHKKFQQQLLPEVNQNTISQEVTFGDKTLLEQKIYFEELSEFQNFGDELQNSVSGFDDEGGGESLDVAIVVNNPGFLVVENDVASDGSVRYVREIQKSGNTRRFLDAYKLFPLGQPEIDNKSTEFVHRAYMGAAIDDQFYLNKNLPRLYRENRRVLRAAKDNPTLESLYQYAMAMIIFPWMESEDNEAETLLKQLAEKGHPGAMYEYGFQLYMHQKDIPEAVKWIVQASKYGLSRAEYRLGKLLLTSPWVINDEKKALFWFASAAEKGDDAAALHVAKVKLTADDESLIDVPGAIQYLDTIASAQNLNPEYQYLLSISYRLRKERDFKKSVELLEKAISMGMRTNWDTSEWQALLAKLLQGNISVTDL
ncbi:MULTISPECIES: tetratricopeptide repeat protein [unclassified Alteromonas]|uniref:tetratricopeptide repeat protein n=1 Tax=unclassified Alteromonas TaxID=2614992 RepID=UPI0005094E22|nr:MULTISPECIES: tetratricopeptide repeat protein [unclassified Alteromonas]